MRSSKLAGAVLWMCCIQFFVAEQIARSAWTLPYSFATNFISDLGSTGCDALVCSPWHAIMNASFALQGILIAGGSILRWPSRGWFWRIGLLFLTASGAGTFVVGLVPENVDPTWHRVFAAIHFLCGGLGLILVGSAARTRLRGVMVAFGLVVLAATVVLGLGVATVGNTLGIGTVERIAAYSIASCMTLMGVSSVLAYLINRPDTWLAIVDTSLGSLFQIR